MPDPHATRESLTRRRSIVVAMVLPLCIAAAHAARAEDLAAQEAAQRQAIIARLPADAAKRAFGESANPTRGPAESIGSYAKGCIAGAVPLPADGPDWQVMRPSRNRSWGNPALIKTVERLAAEVPALGWPGLLIGDMGQPRGGPMVTGHASHQIGLDVDIWLTPMPERRLTAFERDNMAAINRVAADGNGVDRALWGPQFRRLLEAAAELPETARIFVNPAIKRELCREAGGDRAWLRRIRPWWGHRTHFHLRISCPRGEPACRDQAPVPPATAAARSSTGGSPMRRAIPSRARPHRRCWCRSCRRNAQRWCKRRNRYGAGRSMRIGDVVDHYDRPWHPSGDDLWIVADQTRSLLIEERPAFARIPA